MTELWDHLTDTERRAFTDRSVVRHWRRGEVLLRQDDAPDWIGIIHSGRVKVSSHAASGTGVVLAICGPGALLGELSALDGGLRSATVQALEVVSAAVMPQRAFESFLEANGRVSILLMHTLTRRLRDSDRKRTGFGAQDATGRVAARLVELAERFGRPERDAIRIALPLSQDELAGWVGASREAVARALSGLRRLGWIRTGRLTFSVLDLDALRVRAEDT